ncbi:MAG: hypothetical protein KDI33_00675 [Halioglobus sp.]|nr:hypothetical protein [Halioglobus sp.]
MTQVKLEFSFPYHMETLQKALSDAILRLLRPLVRVMLKHGMAYGTFAELARRAFVEEGFEHMQRSGKRPTVSGVSALTGLTRKETKALRESAHAGTEKSAERYNRAIRMISGWINDSEFHDENGGPAELAFDGASGSFSSLVKKYSGDIPPVAMLSVLEASQTVLLNDGTVALKARAYIPTSTPVDKINILGTDVAELISTIGHNLEAEPAQRFFQRKVSNTAVDAEALGKFRELSSRKSQELLEEYNDWLSSHEANPESTDEGQVGYVAVGIYYTEQLAERSSRHEPE